MHMVGGHCIEHAAIWDMFVKFVYDIGCIYENTVDVVYKSQNFIIALKNAEFKILWLISFTVKHNWETLKNAIQVEIMPLHSIDQQIS